MKKIIANTLHAGSFVMQVNQGRSAHTEIPLDLSGQGVISIPDVDGKTITQENRNSLKAHEYGHVALASRNIVPMSFLQEMRDLGADDYLIQSCLDAAVNAFIGDECRHLPFSHDLVSCKKFMQDFQQMDMDQQICYFLQTKGVYRSSSMQYATRAGTEENKQRLQFRKLIAGMEGILRKQPFGDRMIYAADSLAAYTAYSLGVSSKNFEYPVFLQHCKNLLGYIKDYHKSEQANKELADQMIDLGFEVNEEMTWGRMEIENIGLDNVMPRTWKQKHMPRYMGSLRYMHRAITDMKVWGLKDRSIPPMAVLIDCSGSMNLHEKQILAILEKQPASIIAGYSGSTSDGALYILGQNGKYASAEAVRIVREKVGYGNIVDGPALAWLAQQRNKRLIWVTDCNITGSGECQNKEMFRFVDRFVAQYNIEVYRNLDDLSQNKQSGFRVPYRYR